MKSDWKNKIVLNQLINQPNIYLLDSKDFLQALKDKDKVEDKEEEILNEESKPLRNLGFPISATKTFKLVSFSVLGQTVTIKYVISISSSKAVNKIVISSRIGSIEFGNKGCSGSISKSYSYSKQIFQFVVPEFPAVSVGAYGKGSLSWGFGFQSGSGTSTNIGPKYQEN